MYRRIAAVLMPVLAVAVVGLGIWGYQENQEKNSILIKAENQYQAAFHNLNYHLDNLNEELGKALAVNSASQITPSLTNVWRLAYAAEADLGELPLALMEFGKAEEFLSNVGNFSYRTAIRDLGKEPLSDKEVKTLQSLYENSEKIKKDLNGVQSKIIENHLRWMDVETALASEETASDNTIIDGFKTVDKDVEEFGEIDWGPTVQTLDQKQKYDQLKGKEVSSQEVKEIVSQFFSDELTEITLQENGKGLEYESYSVTARPQGSQDNVYLDVTKKGGHVIWMINERKIGEPQISEKKVRQIAADFLEKHGYENMVPVNIQPYDNTQIVSFVPQENGVELMTDAVSVKVALDNGEITGFQSQDYILNHKERTLPQPQLSLEEAQEEVNPQLKVEESGQALVQNEDAEEVLAYMFQGTLNGHTYRVYIDAMTGEEAKVDAIKNIDATKL